MKISVSVRAMGLLVGASLVLAGCAATTADNTTPATLTLGIATPFSSWDPTQATDGHLIPSYQAVYDTLLRREADGSISPWLAEDWNYNDDETQLTLNLRDDVTFSDGSDLTANVVATNLNAYRTGTGAGAKTLTNVANVEAIDDDSIRLDLSAPEPALLIYLSNAAGLIAAGDAVGTPDIATNPIGSGPYTLDLANTVADDTYTFVKREGYWNPDAQKYSKIVIRYLPDVTARVNALISGQVDAAVLDTKSAMQAEGQGFTVLENPLNWRGFVIGDRAGFLVPALADVRVRQAINYAIDDESILKQIYGGYGQSTTQIFGPSSTAFDATLDDKYAYNPAKAKELLTEAGYGSGFTLPFTYWANFTDAAEIPVVIDQFAAVGITAQPVSVPGDAEAADVFAGNYGLSLINLFQPNTFQTITQAVQTGSTYNFFDTVDDTVTADAREIQYGGTSDAAAEAAQDLNRHLVEQAWFSPWFRTSVLWGYDAEKVHVELQNEQAAPSIYNYSPVR